jgi:hypothetical protein
MLMGAAAARAECDAVCRATCDTTWQNDGSLHSARDCYVKRSAVNARVNKRDRGLPSGLRRPAYEGLSGISHDDTRVRYHDR